MVSLNNQKRDFLVKYFDLKLSPGFQELEVSCEFCKSQIKGSLKISKNGNAYSIQTEGEFHHDAEGSLHIYCHECHMNIHDWGIIQRWLKKKGKTVDELPDATKLKPIRKFW